MSDLQRSKKIISNFTEFSKGEKWSRRKKLPRPFQMVSSRKRTRSEENTYDSSIVLPCYRDDKRSLDLDLPDISIPLTDLFHPPLLSEWIPGEETNVSYKSSSTKNHDGKEVDLIQNKKEENEDIEKNEQDIMLTEMNRMLLGKLVATPQYTKQIKDWTE